MESWFSVYPQSEAAEFKRRLQSDFDTASFELILFTYFTRLGFSVTPHPAAPASSRRPDFLVSGEGTAFYLEATTARDQSDEQSARENVKNLVLDAINTADSPHFFLGIRKLTVKHGQQPAPRRIVAFLERELQRFNPNTVPVGTAFTDSPSLTFEDSTARIVFWIMPKSPGLRGQPNVRNIGIGPIESYVGNPEFVFRDAVSSKATRYGLLNAPFVVAVNHLGKFGIHDDTVTEGLFGSIKVGVDTNTHEARPFRDRDGAFMGPTGPINTRVSAVLAASVRPWSLSSARFELVHHPAATHPLEQTLPLRMGRVVDEIFHWTPPTRSLNHVFGVEDSWPGDDAG